jgi:hypothetical protein
MRSESGHASVDFSGLLIRYVRREARRTSGAAFGGRALGRVGVTESICQTGQDVKKFKLQEAVLIAHTLMDRRPGLRQAVARVQ